MRLSSARSLKAELLQVGPAIASSLEATGSFTTATAMRRTARRTMEGIALGVTPARAGREYRLAVRLQRRGPHVDAMTQEIKRKARGEVEIKEVGTIVKLARRPAFFRNTRRPLAIGSSIGDKPPAGFVHAGTLGCFVVRRSSPHYIGVLSNNHVIASENATPIGGPIVQPGTLDGGEFSADVVGELGKVVALKSSGANEVDAAVADIYEGVDYDPLEIGHFGELAGVGDVTSLPSKAKVHKAGRTTGQTTGRITAFDVDNVHVEYDMGVLRFDGQIEIEGTGKKAFSASGDSGSLVVDANLRAIGLLFAGGTVGGSNGKGLTFANPIRTVLEALDVDLEL